MTVPGVLYGAGRESPTEEKKSCPEPRRVALTVLDSSSPVMADRIPEIFTGMGEGGGWEG